MPTNRPTGFETYIYDHKQCQSSDHEDRQHTGALHDPAKLPAPTQYGDTNPLIMVEPSYVSGSNDVVLFFRWSAVYPLDRYTAEQLRDALIKVCQKPLNPEST